ncbi:restriction endonuclease subunit S [Staphylococcus sp. AS1337]|uniref:restriction endonuclease subunit S n=1 Tax=Staphylococcus sp. AS1337 TaxID=3434042 RepID=UPI003F5685D2
MTNEAKHVPELRFPEFEGEWEILKLGDYAIIKGRLGWKGLKQEEYVSKGHAFLIANKHINNGKVNWEKADQITQFRYEESLEIALQKGDLIFSKDGALGNPAIINELPKYATINSTMMLVRPFKEKLSSLFFHQILLSSYFNKLIHLKVSGSSIPHLFQADMKEFYFYTPKLEEQNKIGEFFSKLDRQIELEEQKLEKLEEQKKGYMQKIFSQELRFKDGHGNDYPKWKIKKLGDIGHVSMNKRIYKNETTINGEIPFYKIGTFGKKAETFITRQKFEEYKLKYPYPSKGDILISASGSIGRTIEYSGEEAYYQDSNIVWLQHNDEVLNIFLKHFYLIVKWAGIEGTTIKRLYNKNILNTKIDLPIIEEQSKIGTFFNKIDELIKKQNQKIDRLKERKQGLLQKVFV